MNARKPLQRVKPWLVRIGLVLVAALVVVVGGTFGQNPRYPLPYPPSLPAGKPSVTDQSPEFLKLPAGVQLREGVEMAKAVPVVDFLFYPGQDYPGNPWSVWGDGCAVEGKYYSAIGDHLSPRGNALVYEYDSTKKQIRILANIRKFLESSGALPADMNYTPGKIHSRIDMGSDGWLYYSTHRGSPGTTTDKYGYKGDWIFRTHPETGKTEIAATHPVPKHCIPMSVLDSERLIYYGGTASGKDAPNQAIQLLAYDLRNRKVLLTADNGPDRYAILSRSTGKLYWEGKKYDPASNKISSCNVPHVRAATQETPQGIVYGVSGRGANIWAFDVKTETATQLGSGAVAKQEYITTIDVDPTGRYVYYIPGAHGGSAGDGGAVVQFDVKTKKRKVIAFLHSLYSSRYGYTLDGTFSSALAVKGDQLYITWNGMRQGQPRGWECCALTVIHIPAAERP